MNEVQHSKKIKLKIEKEKKKNEGWNFLFFLVLSHIF